MTWKLINLEQYEKAKALNIEHATATADLLKLDAKNAEARKLSLRPLTNASALRATQGDVVADREVRLQQLKALRGFMASDAFDISQPTSMGVEMLETMNNVANWERGLGQLDSAMDISRQSVERAELLAKRDPEHGGILKAARDAHYTLGQVLEQMGRFPQALREYKAAGKFAAKVEDGNNGLHKNIWAASRGARVLAYMGQRNEALQELERVRERAEGLSQSEPESVDYAETVAVQHERLGEVYLLQGRASDSVDALTRANELLSGVHNRPTLRDIGPRLTRIRCLLAEAAIARGNPTGAMRSLIDAESVLKELTLTPGPESQWDALRLRTNHVRGKTELALGNVAAARTALEAAATLGNGLIRLSPADAFLRAEVKRVEQSPRDSKAAVVAAR